MCDDDKVLYVSDALMAWARSEGVSVSRLKWFWVAKFEHCVLRFGREWAELDAGHGNSFHLSWSEGVGFARFVELARFGRRL